MQKAVSGTDSIYRQTLANYTENLKNAIEQDVRQAVLENLTYSVDVKIKLLRQIDAFVGAAQNRIKYFSMTYQDIFIDNPNTSPYRKNLADDEAGMIKALDMGFELLRQIAEKVRNAKKVSDKELRLLEASTEALNKHGAWMSNPLLKDLNLVLPTRRSQFQVIWKYFFNGVIRGQSLFQIMKSIPDSAFFRPDAPKSKIEFKGWNPQHSQREGVYIVGFTHDYAMYDVLLAQRISSLIGVEEPGLLTVTRSWPHYRLGHAREKNIFFVEDQDLLKKMESYAIAEVSEKGKAVITIAPEGQVPYFNAQFPPTTKVGAFVLARKISYTLGGKTPVYFVPAISNALEHLTSSNSLKMSVFLQNPVLVPNEPLQNNDPWVASQRILFEQLANTSRGTRFADLGNRNFFPKTSLPFTKPVEIPHPNSKNFVSRTETLACREVFVP